MESLVEIQDDIKIKIQKAISNFKKSPKDRLTQSYVETRLELLEKQWSSFEATHKKIISEFKKIDLQKSDYYTKNTYEQTEDLYVDFKTVLKDYLIKLYKHSAAPSFQSTSKSDSSDCVKLPKITIPTFSGKYNEWQGFKDLFISMIHNNVSLDEVQKLHYLKGHLIGEAEQLLRHIPITAANYKDCWTRLEARYNNKRFLAGCNLKRLLGQKRINIESSNNLKELLDTTCECLNALKNLGVEIESWDIIIIYLISSKLDSETRKQWELKISSETESDDLPTFEQFKEFLTNRFRALEFLDCKSEKQYGKSSHSFLTTNKDKTKSCECCANDHKLPFCKKFAKLDIEARRDFVHRNKLCFNCLGSNHLVYSCRQSTRCKICKKRHHSLLHSSNNAFTQKSGDAGEDRSADQNVISSSSAALKQDESNLINCFMSDSSHILLATALVKAESKNGTDMVLRCLLDQGSQASFITESTVQLLGLKKLPIKGHVSGLGGNKTSTLALKSMVILKIQSRTDPSFILEVKAHVLRKLTTLLPERRVPLHMFSVLPSEGLADPTFGTPSKIDLLLGAEVYSQIITEGLIKGSASQPLAQNTKLGWILSGGISACKENTPGSYSVVSFHSSIEDDDIIRKFWELESENSSYNGKKYPTDEELKCEHLFCTTTKRDRTGRFIVKLPFKSEDPRCKYNGSREIAHKQFLNLEKRFLNNSDLKEQYASVIKQYIDLEHIEPVGNIKNPCAVYLPHHAVIRDDKSTTKFRVVFNGSCRGKNGFALNDDLIVGPNLQMDLRHIIMRWRRHPVCITADIVKMFRQIKVSEDDVDFQRFWWRENPEDEVQHFRHLRVTFGTSSAPYLAVRCLQQLAYDNGDKFPLTKERILKDFYMDDLMTGGESVEEGEKVCSEIKEILSLGGFHLQKWASNSEILMDRMEQRIILKKEEENEGKLEIKMDTVFKILGLTWNRKSDEFEYIVQLSPLNLPLTKRKVISDIARLFDPLGWLAPVVISAKILIQQIWLSGIQWDDELPSSLANNWFNYRNELRHLGKFRLPRWIHSSCDDISVELHGFSDASDVAYAAVVYVRIVDKNKNIHVRLITSKTRVAPIKKVSVPRLELCGAVMLAKLLDEVSIIMEISKNHLHAWTDSSVVLAWLSSHPSRWKTFVANRVAEIITIVEGSQWSHVASKENPADCASRGVSPSSCEELHLWKEGPKWLYGDKIKYNKNSIDTEIEIRKSKVTCHASTYKEEDSIINKYSTLKKLIRVVAYCRRFLSKRSEPATIWLNTKELNAALLTCIRICQRQFQMEITAINKKGSVNKNSKLTSLSPYLDEDGILRVGGRIQRALIDADTKHPIIIPAKSHLTGLLISDAHVNTLHGGINLTLNYLRKRYWIINGKNATKQIIRKCVTCIRYSAQSSRQMMGQLPEVRVRACRPFFHSGVDYAGPINVRTMKGRGYHSTKGYICLFICMATKAIHLEIVSDMTTQAFLAAFKRFTARRGHIAELWSDNGTTFVGSARELRSLFAQERNGIVKEIAECLATNGTNWHFIPPHSPNFGGLWEAGIKSTKNHLKRVIGNSTLTFEEMTTVLSQIEACLNSRPISQIQNSPDDPHPLTPGHFIVGESLILPPDFNYENSNISSLSRWHLIQRMLQDFWRRWSNEYLTQLQQRHKWKFAVHEPALGDIVLVKEDNLPPCRWLHGIVIEKHPGLDNLTRVVSLKCKNHIIKRPVSKLIILPIAK